MNVAEISSVLSKLWSYAVTMLLHPWLSPTAQYTCTIYVLNKLKAPTKLPLCISLLHSNTVLQQDLLAVHLYGKNKNSTTYKTMINKRQTAPTVYT